MPFVLATANPDKAREIVAVLAGVDLKLRPTEVPDVDETAQVKTFAVTVEPAEGTPAPTGPMVLAGTVS